MMPRNWSDTRVGELADYVNGYGFAPEEWSTSGRPIIRIQNLSNPNKPFNYYEGQLERKYLVEPGDILISWSATLDAYVWRGPEGWLNQHIFKANVNTEVVDRRFFYFLMKYAMRYISAKSHGSTMKHVTRSVFLQSTVSRPPLPEQRAIAAVLAKLQAAVEVQEQIVETLRALKAATMAKLFREGLRGEKLKQTEIGEIPESWKVVKLGDYCRVGNGSTPNRNNKDYWESGDFPWLTSGKIHEGEIKFADEHVSKLALQECHLPRVPAGSVLIAITGQGRTLGNAALVNFETTVSQHLAYATPTEASVDSRFLWKYLESQYEALRGVARAGGSTKAALTCGYLKTVKFPKPAKGEQAEIASAIHSIEYQIANATKQALTLSELFSATLHQLMTGQLRVTEIMDPEGNLTVGPSAPV